MLPCRQPSYARETEQLRTLHNRPVFRGGYEGWTPPPPEMSTQKFQDLLFCGNVEHVQFKNVTVDINTCYFNRFLVLKWSSLGKLWFSWFLLDLCRCHEHHSGNYSWSITCSRMHQNAPILRRTCQNFLGEWHSTSPDPTPVGAFGSSIRVHSTPRPHFWIRACFTVCCQSQTAICEIKKVTSKSQMCLRGGQLVKYLFIFLELRKQICHWSQH